MKAKGIRSNHTNRIGDLDNRILSLIFVEDVVYDNKILCVCFQPGGNVKSKVSNLCHIFRNMDLTQSFASAKCLRSNGCHRLGDLHRGNLSVAFKNPIRNCCNTFGDDNLAVITRICN